MLKARIVHSPLTPPKERRAKEKGTKEEKISPETLLKVERARVRTRSRRARSHAVSLLEGLVPRTIARFSIRKETVKEKEKGKEHLRKKKKLEHVRVRPHCQH